MARRAKKTQADIGILCGCVISIEKRGWPNVYGRIKTLRDRAELSHFASTIQLNFTSLNFNSTESGGPCSKTQIYTSSVHHFIEQ